MHNHFHFKIRQLVTLLNLVSVTKIHIQNKNRSFFLSKQTKMKLPSVGILNYVLEKGLQ